MLWGLFYLFPKTIILWLIANWKKATNIVQNQTKIPKHIDRWLDDVSK